MWWCQPCRLGFYLGYTYLMIAFAETTRHSYSWILSRKCDRVAIHLRSLFRIPNNICSGQEWRFRQGYLCDHAISPFEVHTLALCTGFLSVVAVHLSQLFGFWFPSGHGRMVFLRQGRIFEAMGKQLVCSKYVPALVGVKLL